MSGQASSPPPEAGTDIPNPSDGAAYYASWAPVGVADDPCSDDEEWPASVSKLLIKTMCHELRTKIDSLTQRLSDTPGYITHRTAFYVIREIDLMTTSLVNIKESLQTAMHDCDDEQQ